MKNTTIPTTQSFSLTSTNSRMTSREISELIGKRHDHVLRDIKLLILQKALLAPSFGEKFEEVPTGNGGTRKSPIYSLDFEATMTLLTGYRSVLRAKVIRRWLELEGKAAPVPEQIPVTTTPSGKWYSFTELCIRWGCGENRARLTLGRMISDKEVIVQVRQSTGRPRYYQFTCGDAPRQLPPRPLTLIPYIPPQDDRQNGSAVRDLECIASGKMLLTRFLVGFDEGGKMKMTALGDNEIVTSLEKLPKRLSDSDLHFEDRALLANIAKAAMDRLTIEMARS